MIKKTIRRRTGQPSTEKPTLEKRHSQATKTVAKTYRQDAQGAVYNKFYEYKKNNPVAEITQEENNGRTI